MTSALFAKSTAKFFGAKLCPCSCLPLWSPVSSFLIPGPNLRAAQSLSTSWEDLKHLCLQPSSLCKRYHLSHTAWSAFGCLATFALSPLTGFSLIQYLNVKWKTSISVFGSGNALLRPARLGSLVYLHLRPGKTCYSKWLESGASPAPDGVEDNVSRSVKGWESSPSQFI